MQTIGKDKAPQIYALMSKIMSEVGTIAKTSSSTGGLRYKYRSIEDIYERLQGILSENMVFYTPFVKSVTTEERPSKEGGVLRFTLVTVDFTFYAPDGSSVVACTVGEGMDSGDKSASKAHTAAVKSCLVQTFCIPTDMGVEGGPDVEPAPKPVYKTPTVAVSCTDCGAVACIPNKFGNGFYCNKYAGGCGKVHASLPSS